MAKKIEELIREAESNKYRIKQIQFKIKELKETYLPGHGLSGIGHSGNGTSPQEVIVVKIDSLEREIQELQLRTIAINDEIYRRLEGIENPKARWIILQRIKGRKWKEIECDGLSIDRMKHIYSQSIESLNGE